MNKLEMSIVTPTYNRAHLLPILYESLKAQSNKQFEWIIIDDGSTDNTEDIVRIWTEKESDFMISFYRVPHGGKHRALNKAVQIAGSPAFFIVDSDDRLTDDAVKMAIRWFSSIKEEDQFAGVSGLRGPFGSSTGKESRKETKYVDATNLERKKFGLLGDKAEIYKTEILKNFPFPEFEEEDFLTEAVVWDAIAAAGYKIRWYSEIIYECEYLPGGLTSKGKTLFAQNPKGWLAYLKVRDGIDPEQKRFESYLEMYFYLKARGMKKLDILQLGTEKDIIERLEEKYVKIKNNTKKNLDRHDIHTLAIYGLGNMGNLFLQILEELEIELAYAVDKEAKSFSNLPVFQPSALPDREVDAICITMQSRDERIFTMLKEHYGIVLFWKDMWET